MWKLGLRPHNSVSGNTQMGFSLQCVLSVHAFINFRDEVEIRRGPGGEAGRLEADDPQLHGEVRLPDLRHHGVI
jgi:hypothetical protein